jgi:hypothetical protein
MDPPQTWAVGYYADMGPQVIAEASCFFNYQKPLVLKHAEHSFVLLHMQGAAVPRGL